MSIRTCPVCGAQWVNNQLYWSTGKPGKDEDLNALVCRNLRENQKSGCVNQQQGASGGIGWAERAELVKEELKKKGYDG